MEEFEFNVKEFEFAVVDELPDVILPVTFCLVTDNWNDYGYTTTYKVYYVSGRVNLAYPGSYELLGAVKVGKRNLSYGSFPIEKPQFYELGEEFFSLGQSSEYYESIRELYEGDRLTLLECLNDVVHDPSIYARNKNEEVMSVSLQRQINLLEFKSFSTLLATGFNKHSYDLIIEPDDLALEFSVSSSKISPSNIHALIGNNGVGKSFLLKRIAKSIVEENFVFNSTEYGNESNIDNVIFVSFSAFDSAVPAYENNERYFYLGLHDGQSGFVSPELLAEQFSYAFSSLSSKASDKYIESIFQPLTNIPHLSDHVDYLLSNINEENNLKSRYLELSSGHRIVFHTLVLLMDKLKIGTVTLIDEPETHLHPPLLAAFVTSLNVIAEHYNGLMVLATHSPIVLQEIPHSCVYYLRRDNKEMIFNRPPIPTYGQNVSTLTTTAFGYQRVGFHDYIKELVDNEVVNESNLDSFNWLGSEAIRVAWSYLGKRKDSE